MDLAQLKAALDAAKKAYEADKENSDLKSKYFEAKEAYEEALADSEEDEEEDEDESEKKKKKSKAPGEQDDEEEEDTLDESGLDEKTKAHLRKLRKENAKHRTKAKNLEDRLGKLEKGLKGALGVEDEEITEESLEKIKGNNEALSFKTAVLEAAIEHGVGKDEREYFEFLVGKRLGALDDGEELSDEDLAEIAKKAKKKSGSGGMTRTSVNDDDAPNPKGGGKTTVDQFVRMSVTEKSELFTKNRALYDELFAQAKEKRRL